MNSLIPGPPITQRGNFETKTVFLDIFKNSDLHSCHIHSLGPLISVVYTLITGCQRLVIYTAPLYGNSAKEVLVFDNPATQTARVNKPSTAVIPFRISSTCLCYIGSKSFQNHFLLFLITTTGQLYAYERTIRRKECWSDQDISQVSVAQNRFLNVELQEAHPSSHDSLPLCCEGLETETQLVISVGCVDTTGDCRLSQRLLICSTQHLGYVTCSLFSLILKPTKSEKKEEEEEQQIELKEMTVSSFCETFERLGHIRVMKVARAPVHSEKEDLECILLISGSKRCGILMVSMSCSPLTLHTKLYCIGTQKISEQLPMRLEAVYLKKRRVSVDCSDTPVYILCERPKKRFWVSNMFGRVLSTLKIPSEGANPLIFLGHLDETHLVTRHISSRDLSTSLELCVISLTSLEIVQTVYLYPRTTGWTIRVISDFWDQLTQQLILLTYQCPVSRDSTHSPESYFILYHVTFLCLSSPLMLAHIAYANFKTHGHQRQLLSTSFDSILASTSTEALVRCQIPLIALPDKEQQYFSHEVLLTLPRLPSLPAKPLGSYFWPSLLYRSDIFFWFKVLVSSSSSSSWTLTPVFSFFPNHSFPFSSCFLTKIQPPSPEKLDLSSLEQHMTHSGKSLDLFHRNNQLHLLHHFVLERLLKHNDLYHAKPWVQNHLTPSCHPPEFCLDVVIMRPGLSPVAHQHKTLFSQRSHEGCPTLDVPTHLRSWTDVIQFTEHIGFTLYHLCYGVNQQHDQTLSTEP